MKSISVEDRCKIQSHLAEIWKILYANGLEELECNRTPNSKQKRRMWEMHVKYNKDHADLTEGFGLSVSDYVGCLRKIEFESTKEEEDTWEKRKIGSEIRLKRWEKKERRRRELDEEHHVAYWHKNFMTPYWTSGYSDIRYSKQNEEGTLSYVGPRPDRFVWWLFHASNFDGNEFTAEAREKYMKKYGLDKEYDVKTGKPIKTIDDAAEMKKEDKSKKVKDYLRKKFEDGSWKKEASNFLLSEHEKSLDVYLDTVREFIKQQEEFDLHGMALYGINEERTKAHEALLDEYGFNSNDEKSAIARDVTKSIDFVGECKFVDGKIKTVFYPVYEASLRLAYALDVVKYADEYLKR